MTMPFCTMNPAWKTNTSITPTFRGRALMTSAHRYCHIWTLPAGKGFVERECKWSGAVISTACECGSYGRGP
jgi:hypothetical protein